MKTKNQYRQPKIFRLLREETDKSGQNRENLVKYGLEYLMNNKIPLSNGGIIVDFRMIERYSKEDMVAKDAIFTILAPDGDRIEAWFNVKSSWRGLQEHAKKHLDFLIPCRGPLIKKIRPAFKMDIRHSTEATIDYAVDKIQKVATLFIELHLLEATRDENLRGKYNERNIHKYIIIE